MSGGNDRLGISGRLGAEKEGRDALEEENTEASCTAAFSFRLGIAMDEAFCFIIRIICGF